MVPRRDGGRPQAFPLAIPPHCPNLVLGDLRLRPVADSPPPLACRPSRRGDRVVLHPLGWLLREAGFTRPRVRQLLPGCGGGPAGVVPAASTRRRAGPRPAGRDGLAVGSCV